MLSLAKAFFLLGCRRYFTQLVVVLSLVCLSASVGAQKLYTSVVGGASVINPNTSQSRFFSISNTLSSGAKFNLGYQAFNRVGMELFYTNLGAVTVSPDNSQFAATQAGAALTYIIPFSNRWDLTMRGGAAAIDIDWVHTGEYAEYNFMGGIALRRRMGNWVMAFEAEQYGTSFTFSGLSLTKHWGGGRKRVFIVDESEIVNGHIQVDPTSTPLKTIAIAQTEQAEEAMPSRIVETSISPAVKRQKSSPTLTSSPIDFSDIKTQYDIQWGPFYDEKAAIIAQQRIIRSTGRTPAIVKQGGSFVISLVVYDKTQAQVIRTRARHNLARRTYALHHRYNPPNWLSYNRQWRVQLGVFVSRQRADALRKKTQEAGFSNAVVNKIRRSGKEMYPVQVIAYSPDEAQRMKHRVDRRLKLQSFVLSPR